MEVEDLGDFGKQLEALARSIPNKLLVCACQVPSLVRERDRPALERNYVLHSFAVIAYFLILHLIAYYLNEMKELNIYITYYLYLN